MPGLLCICLVLPVFEGVKSEKDKCDCVVILFPLWTGYKPVYNSHHTHIHTFTHPPTQESKQDMGNVQ